MQKPIHVPVVFPGFVYCDPITGSSNPKPISHMAEQEIIKHTKKMHKIWHSKEHSFWLKCKEFVIEIAIIVFAVTLSIWFHNRSEHAHQQEDVKIFLLGLKGDLTNDVEEMQNDSTHYQDQKAAFSYITSIKMNQELSMDSLLKYHTWLFNTTALHPNNGRFEGFKSSGKIGAIENEELQNDIMDLYQEDIVSLLGSTNDYVHIKNKLFDYMFENRKRINDSTSNIRAVLAQDEAQNISLSLRNTDEVVERYSRCITKAKKIIAEINKEYGLH